MQGLCFVPPVCAPQIADFGLAKHLVNQPYMSTVCGTWAYSAPEVRIFRQPYNYKVDIWSLGIIIFTLCVAASIHTHIYMHIFRATCTRTQTHVFICRALTLVRVYACSLCWLQAGGLPSL